MGNRKIFITLLIVIVAGYGASLYFAINSHRSVPYVNTIPRDGKFSTLASTENDITTQDIPTVYNLPPEISWSQVTKLRMFLYQFGDINNMTSRPDGYYREGSVSNSKEVEVLLDIPSATQTLSIRVLSNNTLDIACASAIDQKEVSWKCSDGSLGESE